MVKEILINIGNTHTQFAVFDGENVILTQTLPTSQISVPVDEIQTLRENRSVSIFVASVVPEVNEMIKTVWTDHELRFLNWEMLTDIDFSKVDITTVGADRLANISAAVSTLELPVIIIDCGTAITTEVVDENCSFIGGAIIPGRKLWRKALNLHTGQLPEVNLSDIETPAIGTTTIDALAAMDCAVIGAVERLIMKSLQVVKNANVYFTGGDAYFFAKGLGGKELPKNFTLIGLSEVVKKF